MTGLPLASVQMYVYGRAQVAAQALAGGGLTERQAALLGQLTIITQTLLIQRGLPDPQVLTRGQGRMLVLTRAPGPGLMLEHQYDAVMVTCRTVGEQDDYDDAEALADVIDTLMLADSNVLVGDTPALYVRRAGAGPVPVMQDRSRRTHFQCSYAIPAESGLYGHS